MASTTSVLTTASVPNRKAAGHLAPLAQDVEQRADQSTDREAARPWLPFRLQKLDCDRRKHQGDAEPPD